MRFHQLNDFISLLSDRGRLNLDLSDRCFLIPDIWVLPLRRDETHHHAFDNDHLPYGELLDRFRAVRKFRYRKEIFYDFATGLKEFVLPMIENDLAKMPDEENLQISLSEIDPATWRQVRTEPFEFWRLKKELTLKEKR